MHCPVCSKSTKFYPLCEKYHDLKDAGKITRCIICGKWNDADGDLCRKKNWISVFDTFPNL